MTASADVAAPTVEDIEFAQTRRRSPLLSVGLFVLLLGVWELLVRGFKIPVYVIPAPSVVAVSLFGDLTGTTLTNHAATTLEETIIGFLLGSLMGFVLGALVAQFPLVEELVYPYIVALQTMPKVAIAPLLVIWLGFGLESKVVIAALVAFFPLLVNVIVGLKTTEQDKLELMLALAASRWQTFRMVRLPNALPIVFGGLEVAMVFSIVGAIVGEFVGAKAGLGYLINYRNYSLDVPGIFSVLVILSIMGLILDYGIKLLGKRLVFWASHENVTSV